MVLPPPLGSGTEPQNTRTQKEERYIHPESKLPITRQNSWEIAWRREILGVLQSTEPKSGTARAPWLEGRQPFPEGQWPWPLQTEVKSSPYSSAVGACLFCQELPHSVTEVRQSTQEVLREGLRLEGCADL